MTDRIAVIIADRDPDKARTGLMYATNALKHGWLADVRVFFFGPAERTLLENEDLQEQLRLFQTHERSVAACRFLAERDGISAPLAGLGVEVQFVGSKISDLIKQGYAPMVW